MVVNGVFFDDCLTSAEGCSTLDAVELCDGDPDGLWPGPGGVLHVGAKGHVTDTRAVAIELWVNVRDFVRFDFFSA